MSRMLNPTELKKRIKSGEVSRQEIFALHTRWELKLGEDSRKELISELLEVIRTTYVPPLQREYLFMGYCPGADLKRRRDEIWLKDGFCNFAFLQSKHQAESFRKVRPNDLIILKKREKFGKTMLIHAWGTVQRLRANADGARWLEVDWTGPLTPLEVPLMGCNSTVNFRSLEQVENHMPDNFWDWLAT